PSLVAVPPFQLLTVVEEPSFLTPAFVAVLPFRLPTVVEELLFQLLACAVLLHFRTQPLPLSAQALHDSVQAVQFLPSNFLPRPPNEISRRLILAPMKQSCRLGTQLLENDLARGLPAS